MVDVFSIGITGGYFSPLGPRPHGLRSHLEEDAIPCVHAKPRAPLNSIRLFALQPLVNDGFDRFRNLLKVEAKTTQQICLCHLGHKPKVCLLTAKLGVQLKQKLKKSFLFTENSQRSQLSGLKPADKGAMSDA